MARADVRKQAASSSAAGSSGAAGASSKAAGASSKAASASSKAASASSKAAGASASGSGPGEPPIAFEAALAKLEEVVDRLEGGELELEVALASFEEGVRLTRQCADQLDTAERRIDVLMKEGDSWMERPFDEHPGDEPASEDASDDESRED